MGYKYACIFFLFLVTTQWRNIWREFSNYARRP